MNKEETVNELLKLPVQYKGVLVGVLLSSVALFLPWYSELDTFGKGVKYNALTGPTALVGLTLLIINLVTLVYLVYYAKKSEKFTKAPLMEKWHGIIFLYFSFVLISIYFHSDFGAINVNKSLGFGFYLGVISSVISFFFGLIQFQTERKSVHATYLKKNLEEVNIESEVESEELELPKFRERLDRFSSESPVFKERIQKQKQIEEKIKNKLNH